MSRDYSKVRPEFWTRGTGKGLRGDLEAQVVAMYLITGPASHMTGLFYLPAPTLSHETGIPFEGALKALRTLSEGGFAHFDEACDLVWVPNMAREQIGASLKPRDHQIRAVVKHVEKFANHPFYQQFMDLYGRVYSIPSKGPSKPLASPFEAPSQGSQNGRVPATPSQGSPDPLADPLRSQDQDQDQEQDQEQEGEPARAHAIPGPGVGGVNGTNGHHPAPPVRPSQNFTPDPADAGDEFDRPELLPCWKLWAIWEELAGGGAGTCGPRRPHRDRLVEVYASCAQREPSDPEGLWRRIVVAYLAAKRSNGGRINLKFLCDDFVDWAEQVSRATSHSTNGTYGSHTLRPELMPFPEIEEIPK